MRKATKPAEDPQVASVRLKAAALKRNMKDLEFAEKEVTREKARLETYLAEASDKVPQQHKVIAEAEMMVPLARTRIERSYGELQTVLAAITGEGVPDDNEEIAKAREASAAAAQLVATFDTDESA